MDTQVEEFSPEVMQLAREWREAQDQFDVQLAGNHPEVRAFRAIEREKRTALWEAVGEDKDAFDRVRNLVSPEDRQLPAFVDEAPQVKTRKQREPKTPSTSTGNPLNKREWHPTVGHVVGMRSKRPKPWPEGVITRALDKTTFEILCDEDGSTTTFKKADIFPRYTEDGSFRTKDAVQSEA